MSSRAKVLAIDLGGTKIIATLFDSTGRVLQSLSLKTEQNFLLQLTKLYQSLSTNWGKIQVVSLGVPGPVSNSCMESSFPLNTTEETKFDQCFEGAKQIIIENDLFMALYAELSEGVGLVNRNFVLLSISTGIGVGVVIDSKPLKIRSEMGHQKLFIQSTDNAFSHENFEGWANFSSGRALATGHRATDLIDIKTINAVAIHNLILAYDPEHVVIMGGVALNLYDSVIPSSTELSRLFGGREVKISKTKLGAEIGVRGAFLLAKYSLSKT